MNSCFADKIKVATALYQRRGKKDDDAADVLRRFRSEFVTDSCANDDDLRQRCAADPEFDPQTPLVNIRYVGVWDTVKTIGSSVFGDHDRDGEVDAAAFHDHHLHPTVKAAQHAVAIDERRKKFDVTLWDNVDALNADAKYAIDDPRRPYQQQWFPGGHGSVGGGGDIRGLSDEGLEWVLQGAKMAGLALETTTVSKIWGLQPDVLAPLENSSDLGWSPKEVAMRLLPKADRDGPKFLHEVSRAALVRWKAPASALPENHTYRPAALKDVARLLDQAEPIAPWEYAARGGYAEAGETVSPIETEGRRLERYIVQSGDDLPKIALRCLGDAKRAPEIEAVNRTSMMDPGRLYVGQVLNLPAH